MSLVCACPLADQMTSLPSACLEDLGVPVKLILHRTKNPSGTVYTFDANDDAGDDTDDPTTITFWNVYTGTTSDTADATKFIPTPIIHAVEMSGGEPREYGGGNATRGGIPIVRGSEFVQVNGEFLRVNQQLITVLKTYSCEDGNLSAFFVHEGGQISGIVDSQSSPTTFRGFPIQSWHVGDKMMGQRDGIDKNMVRFSLEEDYSNLLYAFNPAGTFNPVTDL